MTFEVIFDEKAIDFLNGLPKEMKERIFNKIIAAKEHPHHFLKRLVGRNDYKLRVGDYRIIVDLNLLEKMMKVTLIEHRSVVYD